MRVLVSAFPFLNQMPRDGIEFVYHPWNRRPQPQEVTEEVVRGKYHGLIAGTERIERAIADQASNLKVVSRVGSGVDNVDVEYFAARGITTTYTPFGPVDAVAEMTVGLIVAALRNFRAHDLRVRAGEWKRDFGRRLSDCRVGIVGFGRIGRRVASLLAAFRCQILLHDEAPDEATAHAMGLPFLTKAELLSQADVITLHLPLKRNTQDWLSASDLPHCRGGVVIINASRGGIVNEPAMVTFLTEHPDAYYCGDVFSEEPYHGELTKLPNTLLLPHIGASTRESRLEMELLALENCERVLKGETCSNVVARNL